MRVKRHFRCSSATIDYILSDLNLNRITNKESYLQICVNNRIEKLHYQYDTKLDKILSFIIINCDIDNMPIQCLSQIAFSLAKVTNVLAKGFISVIGG